MWYIELKEGRLSEKDRDYEMTIKLSVIVPVYNVKDYLQECLESILVQSYCNFETILIDDGSSDGSSELCDEWAAKDSRITCIHKANGGASTARNEGIKACTGDYVIFMDADDYWDDEHFLEQAVASMTISQADVAVFGWKKVGNKGSFDSFVPKAGISIIDSVKSGDFNMSPTTKLVKTKLLKDNDIFFRTGVINEDMEWCARIFLAAEKFDSLAMNPYCYRQRQGSVTHVTNYDYARDVKSNYKNCLKLQQYMTSEKSEAYQYYLARGMSMFIINLSCYDKAERQHYSQFVRDNLYVLRYSNRFREKLILLSIKVLGIGATEYLLRRMMK